MQITTVRIAAEADIARVRQVADRVAESLGMERFGRTRAVTACLEVARNALQYAGGGRATFRVYADRSETYLSIAVVDQGSGIKGGTDFLRGRATYGTAEGLGAGGLGLGLRGVKRLSDRFDLDTGSEGTSIEIAFEIPVSASELPDRARGVSDALLEMAETDPVVELTRQNRELANALAERELLVSEVHHRTGNNLALILGFIQMSRRGANTDETRRVLTELEMRVHSVAQVHKELHRAAQADRIELLPFLKSVANHAAEAFSTEDCEVEVHVTGDPADIRSGTAIDLGLITGELITNAFKHAFAGRQRGRVDITFQREEDRDGPGACILTVSDDGVGMQGEEEKPGRPESLGWRMIRAMASRHGGSIRTDAGAGFATVISFPPELVVDENGENEEAPGAPPSSSKGS